MIETDGVELQRERREEEKAMNKKICGKSEGAAPDEWYLVVLLAKNQLFPGPDQHVQRKPEEEAIVILRERILSKQS